MKNLGIFFRSWSGCFCFSSSLNLSTQISTPFEKHISLYRKKRSMKKVNKQLLCKVEFFFWITFFRASILSWAVTLRSMQIGKPSTAYWNSICCPSYISSRISLSTGDWEVFKSRLTYSLQWLSYASTNSR